MRPIRAFGFLFAFSLVDRWLGHQTEEMRLRYQHLFPDEQQAIRTVFG